MQKSLCGGIIKHIICITLYFKQRPFFLHIIHSCMELVLFGFTCPYQHIIPNNVWDNESRRGRRLRMTSFEVIILLELQSTMKALWWDVCIVSAGNS